VTPQPVSAAVNLPLRKKRDFIIPIP